jgi:AcrR family transcriptional regulator
MPSLKPTIEQNKLNETVGNISAGLSRKEKEYLLRRQTILDAALKLFATKGYAGASMQEIAQASEFSIGTLYNFFETKESLYRTIIEEKFRQAKESIEAALLDEKGCIEKITKAVGALLNFMEENREFFNIFLGFRSAPETGMHGGVQEKVMEYYQEHVRFFQELMQEGIREGLFRDFSSLELALSLIGNCNAVIHDWLMGPGDNSLMAQHERILDLFFNGALKHTSTVKQKRG